MDDNAKSHLSRDPVMKNLIESFCIKEYWGQQPNYFLNLIEIITGQQLSTKAAKIIFARFLALYPNAPTPEDILDTSSDILRSIGFSGSKVSYVKNIAQAIIDDNIKLSDFDNLPDEEITSQLLQVKGIGPWSTEMFLIFTLHRPDVFSLGDLGLRTAIKNLYHISRDDKKAIAALSENWRPYRSHACRLLWMSLEQI